MTHRFESHWGPDGLCVRDRETGQVRTLASPEGNTGPVEPPDGMPPAWSVDALARTSPTLAGWLEGRAPGVHRGLAWLLAPDATPWSSSARRRARAASAAALAGLCVLLVAPLLLRRGSVLVSSLHGAPLERLVSLRQAAAIWPALPTDTAPYGWPDPATLTVAPGPEVWLVAPWLALQDWTLGWGLAQAWVLVANALGVVALARAAGARSAGLVTAGALALVCQQLWADLFAASLSTVWPGLACGAFAALVAVVRGGLGRGAALGVGAVGVALGWTAWTVSPAYVGLFAPVAALLCWSWGPSRRRRANLAWGLGALVLLAVSLDVFSLFRDAAACQDLRCGEADTRLSLSQLGGWLPTADRLGRPGALVFAWVLLPVGWATARRGPLVLGSLFTALLALASLGPCPAATVSGLADAEPLSVLRPLACLFRGAREDASLLTAATLSAAVLGGAGLASVPFPRLRWLLAGPTCAAAAVCWLPGLGSGDAWQTPEPSPAAAFLGTVPAGPVVELPYDRRGQLLSALDHPARARRNPPSLVGVRPSSDPVLRWVDALGLGTPLPAQTPTAEMLTATGLQWIVLEPSRCGQHGTHCGQDFFQVLGGVLGAPRVHGDGTVVAWAVTPNPDLSRAAGLNPTAPSVRHVDAPPGAPGGGQQSGSPTHTEVHPPEGPHTQAGPGEGAPGAAPGFALDIRVRDGSGPSLTVHVAERVFVPNDAGEGEDLQAGDGIWTALIEHYPPQRPLEVRWGGASAFTGDIALQTGQGIPRMEVVLSPPE